MGFIDISIALLFLHKAVSQAEAALTRAVAATQARRVVQGDSPKADMSSSADPAAPSLKHKDEDTERTKTS
jgi:hypothetical protein